MCKFQIKNNIFYRNFLNKKTSDQIEQTTNIDLNTRNISSNIGELYLEAYETDYSTIEYDDIGEMDQICPKCGAFNFKDEKVGDYYTICCQNGKINLPQYRNHVKLSKIYIQKMTPSP